MSTSSAAIAPCESVTVSRNRMVPVDVGAVKLAVAVPRIEVVHAALAVIHERGAIASLDVRAKECQVAAQVEDAWHGGGEHAVLDPVLGTSLHHDAARGLQIHQQGGGGSDRTVDQDFWVSPLPPEGPVTFVLSWPAFGMPESRTVVDSAPIREAAGRAQELWPPQSYWEETHEPPPPPPRPETGWFSYPEG